MTNFDAVLASAGGQVTAKVEVAPGIYEIEYKLPKGMNRDPEIKTVYDPKVYSDAQMTSMASEAAARAQIQFQVTGGKEQYIQIGSVWFYAPINISTTGVVNGIRTVFPRVPPKGAF